LAARRRDPLSPLNPQRGGAMGCVGVESESIQEVDYGDFLMTTQSIYFGGREHGVNFRLPYKQIVRFQPYSDAVGTLPERR